MHFLAIGTPSVVQTSSVGESTRRDAKLHCADVTANSFSTHINLPLLSTFSENYDGRIGR